MRCPGLLGLPVAELGFPSLSKCLLCPSWAQLCVQSQRLGSQQDKHRPCSPGVRVKVCGLVVECSSQNAVERSRANPVLQGILHLGLDE